MYISFWMNYKDLREGYTLHYQEEDMELISGDDYPVPDGSKFQSNLFHTLCDIMSINFSTLIRNLDVIKNLDAEYADDEIINILKRISPVLLYPPLIQKLSNDLFLGDGLDDDDYEYDSITRHVKFSNKDSKEHLENTLNEYAIFQKFTLQFMENQQMQSANVFTAFVNNVLLSSIPKNIIIKEHREHIENGNYFEHYDSIKLRSVDDLMKIFLKDLKTQDESEMYYFAEKPVDVLIASFYEIIKGGYLIKRCQLCGKLFVPYNRTDTIYCDRPSPKDKKLTCKKYGSQKLWYDQLKNDEAKRLARNIYQSKQMLVRRNPDIAQYEASFEKFKEQLKQWKTDVKAGMKDETEYIEWLNQVKGKRVL